MLTKKRLRFRRECFKFGIVNVIMLRAAYLIIVRHLDDEDALLSSVLETHARLYVFQNGTDTIG